MANGSLYFPHDYATTTDPKIQALIGEHGAAGYGIYWRIIEMLHSDDDHVLPLKKYIYLAIAKQMLTNAEQIEAMINDCINTYELIKSDGEMFWSERVKRNIETRADISKKRAEAGKLGAEKRKELADAKQIPTNAKQTLAKERKRKEIERVPARQFYDEQLKYSNDDQNYKIFIETLYGNNKAEIICNGILSLERQLGYDHFLELLKRFRAVEKSMLQYTLDIENGGYYKRRKDLYLIFNKWLEKDEQ